MPTKSPNGAIVESAGEAGGNKGVSVQKERQGSWYLSGLKR